MTDPVQPEDKPGVVTAKDYDKALLIPSQVFEGPMDIVNSHSLTPEQKLKLLKSWEVDARSMQNATSENMSGGELSRFDEVREAVIKLCDQEGLTDPDDIRS